MRTGVRLLERPFVYRHAQENVGTRREVLMYENALFTIVANRNRLDLPHVLAKFL